MADSFLVKGVGQTTNLEALQRLHEEGMDTAHNGILAGGVLLVYAASLLALAAQRLDIELILEKLEHVG